VGFRLSLGHPGSSSASARRCWRPESASHNVRGQLQIVMQLVSSLTRDCCFLRARPKWPVAQWPPAVLKPLAHGEVDLAVSIWLLPEAGRPAIMAPDQVAEVFEQLDDGESLLRGPVSGNGEGESGVSGSRARCLVLGRLRLAVDDRDSSTRSHIGQTRAAVQILSRWCDVKPRTLRFRPYRDSDKIMG
jgi:hypothetical protein